MLPVLQIGPLVLQLPGLVLLAGLWVALDLIEKEARILRLSGEAIVKVIFYALVGSLIGGRLLFVAAHADVYLSNPLGLFSLDTVTLDPYGAVAIGILITLVLGKRSGLWLRPCLDAVVPGLAVMMIAFAVSHLLSGDAYGSPIDLPWAIRLWGERRHPTQVYEILAAVAVYLAWRRRPTSTPVSGVGFIYWLVLQTGAIIFLEAFRADSAIWPGGFRATQVIGIGVLLASLGMARAWKGAEAVRIQPTIEL